MAGLTQGQENKTCTRHGFEDSRFELRYPISPSFHCPICMNVLNDPVMCRDNQHYFCRACITEHLKNTHNCPTCKDELSADTLVKAPRIVIEYLSELRIHCDFYSRGCRDVVQLNALERHVSTCAFAAVKCMNKDCGVVVNRQDKLHHEAEVCEFRRLQCHDCVELKEEVKCMNSNAAKLLKQVEDLSGKMNRMCEMQTWIMAEMKRRNQITYPCQQFNPVHCDTACRSIIIAGGEDDEGDPKNSVEIFTLQQKTWTLHSRMSTCRTMAAAVVYQGEVIISGGKYDKFNDTDEVETSSCNEPLEWNISPVKLPESCSRHAAVTDRDSLIVSGGVVRGWKTTNEISQVSMVPPYSKKILTTMPAAREDHAMELFEDKIFIFGGYSRGGIHDSVMVFDIIAKEWKMMPPLPFAVDEMATVLWQNNVIVVGGRDSDGGARNTVVMYNLTSGESQNFPPMKHRRCGCSAVATAEVLVVMGGRDEDLNCLKSVEAFSFQRWYWEELPAMNEARAFASAVVKPN